MDNTLIPFGESRASERTVAAIHELMDAGVRFGPATGRDYYELLRFFRMDESCFQTGILSNGKRVRLDGSYVRTVLIPHDALVKIDEALRPEKGMFLVCYPEQTNLLNPAYGVGTTTEELAVFEAGISRPGEMERLEPIIRPTVGIFTNLGDAHQENFKCLKQKAQESFTL